MMLQDRWPLGARFLESRSRYWTSSGEPFRPAFRDRHGLPDRRLLEVTGAATRRVPVVSWIAPRGQSTEVAGIAPET